MQFFFRNEKQFEIFFPYAVSCLLPGPVIRELDNSAREIYWGYVDWGAGKGAGTSVWLDLPGAGYIFFTGVFFRARTVFTSINTLTQQNL
jgi:hypothetical protein